MDESERLKTRAAVTHEPASRPDGTSTIHRASALPPGLAAPSPSNSLTLPHHPCS
jgi:hypothetical protein